MTRWRVWQRAVAIAALAVVVVALADMAAGNRLTGRGTIRKGEHIVAVLADPTVRPELAPVVDAWAARAQKPVRVEWVASTRIAELVLGGEPVDVVVVVGSGPLHRIRQELAQPPVQVIGPGTWLGAVTNLGQPLTRTLRRSLPKARL